MSNRLSFTLSATLVLLWIGAGTAAAQKSTTRGFNVGLHFQGASLAIEGADADNGGGGGLHVGYGFNRIFTLYSDIDGSVIEVANAPNLTGDWALAHVDLGVRLHLANSLRAFIPYLDVALGLRAVSVDQAQVEGELQNDVTFSGADFSLGGGLSWYLSEAWAIDATLKWSTGEFTEIQIGSVSVGGLDIDAKSVRFDLGVVWWP